MRNIRDNFKSTIGWIRCQSRRVFGVLNNMGPSLTAVATALLVLVAFLQWETLEKTDQTNREINRAFVKGASLNISDVLLNRFFTVVLENSGNTQAKNMEVFVDADFRLDEINMPPASNRRTPQYTPADPEFVYLKKRDSFPAFNRIPLGAKAATTTEAFGPTLKHLEAMAANRSDGYIYGVIWMMTFF